MNKIKDVSIIILNFNTKELLSGCLESLEKSLKNTSLKTEVIVVDNASIDGSAKEVKKKFKFARLLKNKVNLGFAAGNNVATAQTSGKYLLFLNPDTLVYKDTLPAVVKFMEENTKVAVVTCRVEFPNGALDPDCHRGFPTPWRAFCHFTGLGRIFPKSEFFNGYHLGGLDFDHTQEIDACVGAFMMVRREAAEKVGWWDEDYFFYGEDIDWCYRFKEKGWKIIYYPFVKITHLKGASSGIRKETKEITTADINTKKRIASASVKAMEIFYKKHYFSKYNVLLNYFILGVLKIFGQLRMRRVGL